MFPLRHPLRTPQLVDQPTATPNAAKLELSDEYIAELLLREARDAAKAAEKYGVMSYLGTSRVVPQRKEKPDAQFFHNVMRNTMGSSEFQERKRQLQKMQQEDAELFRRRHMPLTGERDARGKGDDERKEKRSKKEKHEKKEKKAKKEKKHKHKHSHSSDAKPAAAPLKPSTPSSAAPRVRGRGARAFNPSEPDAAHADALYESLPVQKDDPPEVLERQRGRAADSSSDSSSSRSRSRSPSPRRRRSPSPRRHRYRSQSRSPSPRRRERSPSPIGPRPRNAR